MKKDINTFFWIIFCIAAIGAAGYYFYHSRQNDIIKQQKFEADEQKARLIAEDNEKYAQTLKSICNKKLQDLTGIELYRCMNSNNGDYQYTLGFETTDMKADLAEPNIPSNCARKVGEFTGNELFDCLEEK